MQDAGPEPDGPIDAPPGDPPGRLTRVDWRTMRGAPLATSVATVPTSELFAVSAQGFVTRSGCRGPEGCNYAWRDRSGAAGRQRERMAPVTTGSISPDGRRALLVALDQIELCNQDDSQFMVARGALELLDLATGEVDFQLKLRSNQWSAAPFTPHSDFLFAAPITGTACMATATGLRSVAAPFGPPPGLPANAEFVQAITARRWVVLRGSDLGIVDPLTPGSFQFLGDDPSRWDVTRGWLHVYLGFGDLAQDVLSIAPDGATRETELRDEDWHPFGATDRWVRVCRVLQPEGYRDCRVVDMLGERQPVNFRATFAPDHPDDAVVLADGAVVFVGPVGAPADGVRAVQRIQLATGEREVLHPGDGRLRSLGDGTAALLLQEGSAWLIETAREELIATAVDHVISVPRLPLFGRLPSRIDDLALVVRSQGTGKSLHILDVRSRQLASVTDRLFFVPPRGGQPFAFDDGCGQPWTARHAGVVVEAFLQQPHQLFFVELGLEAGLPAQLYVLPLDLSAPPRRLATLSRPPASCHAPLASPDGRHLGFAENGTDGTVRITLSTP